MLGTYIPADLQVAIDEYVGHQDYAPYVLDGQTADEPDCYSDVVLVIEGHRGFSVIKFTRDPEGEITHYAIKEPRHIE